MNCNKKNILILGASGEIGHASYIHLRNKGFRCSGTSTNRQKKSEFITYDLSENINNSLNLIDYTHCIICAGLTSIAKCEEQMDFSKYINIDRTINFIEKAKKSDLKVIFLSSSEVFKGDKPFYSVTDKTSPLTNYGKSKLTIENYLLNNLRDSSSIIRLSKVISNQTPFIIKWKKFAKNNQQIKAYEDKYISPLSISRLVFVLEEFLKNDIFGLFHLGGTENFTYLEFCRKFFSKDKNLNNLIKPMQSNSKYPHSSLETFLPKKIYLNME